LHERGASSADPRWRASRLYNKFRQKSKIESLQWFTREQMTADDSEQRLQKILEGAFAGPPTPLKEIPTRDGERRAERKDHPPKRRRQRKKRAA
jgi:hypothetical protein